LRPPAYFFARKYRALGLFQVAIAHLLCNHEARYREFSVSFTRFLRRVSTLRSANPEIDSTRDHN
jgi:hypothetical protein